MVDQNEPTKLRRDPAARAAALWATVIALPITVAIVAFALTQFSPSEAEPSPSPTSAHPQSTEPVAMAAPPLDEWPATVCRALLAKLPTSLDDLQQRPVTAGSEQNAAYGDPAITLACGVPAPTFAPDETVWVVNEVCWRSVENESAVTLTTVDREIPVEVTVPRAYDQPLQWAAPLSKAIAESVRPAESTPVGCTG